MIKVFLSYFLSPHLSCVTSCLPCPPARHIICPALIAFSCCAVGLPFLVYLSLSGLPLWLFGWTLTCFGPSPELDLPSSHFLPSHPASSRRRLHCLQVNNCKLLHSFVIQSLQFSECARCCQTGSTFFCQFIRDITHYWNSLGSCITVSVLTCDSKFIHPNASCPQVCLGQYDLVCFTALM